VKRKHAFEAIKAILAAIDDDELPTPSKIQQDGDTTIAWFGGYGRHLSSARRNGVLEPLIYRDGGAREAIELEAVYRLDLKHQSKGKS